MGICFFCPNGHPLNVKAEYAGKVAKCPKCSVKMRVPIRSTREENDKHYTSQPTAELVSDDAERAKTKEKTLTNASGSSEPLKPGDVGSVIHQVATGSPISRRNRHSDSGVDDSSVSLDDPNVLWTAFDDKGGVYGPAQGAVIRTWIREKRIGHNTLILRSGSSQKKRAIDLFPREFDAVSLDSRNVDGLSVSSSDDFRLDIAPSGDSFGAMPRGSQEELRILERDVKKARMVFYAICVLVAVILTLVVGAFIRIIGG